MASEVHDLYIYVQTPVHIGGAQEKHLAGGLDYLIEDQQIVIFDHSKLMKEAGVDAYLNALEKGGGGIKDLLQIRRIDRSKVAKAVYPITGVAGDYKAMIREGLRGRPYIPGSSIKGAIRSVLFRALFDLGDNRKVDKKIDEQVLGRFEKSIMRFIHCSDAYFEDIRLYNTKIFNLRQVNGTWEGGWKHAQRNQTDNKFSPQGFTVAYESLPIGSVARFRLSFGNTLFEGYKGLSPEIRRLFKERITLSGLFELIHQHTDEYLRQEESFFDHYPVSETPHIMQVLKELGGTNKAGRPLMRMASGSGFHSITGNWRFEDHLQTIRYPDQENSNRQYQGGLYYKSRRMAFESGGNAGYQFYPMGFIQLLPEEYYRSALQPTMEAKARAEAEAKRKVEALRQQRELEEQKRVEEARLPKIRTLQQVKKEGLLDAEVIGQSGMQVLLKPFVQGYETQTLHVRYAAGFEKGTIVYVKARVQKKQLILLPPPKVKK